MNELNRTWTSLSDNGIYYNCNYSASDETLLPWIKFQFALDVIDAQYSCVLNSLSRLKNVCNLSLDVNTTVVYNPDDPYISGLFQAVCNPDNTNCSFFISRLTKIKYDTVYAKCVSWVKNTSNFSNQTAQLVNAYISSFWQNYYQFSSNNCTENEISCEVIPYFNPLISPTRESFNKPLISIAAIVICCLFCSICLALSLPRRRQYIQAQHFNQIGLLNMGPGD